jgi:hypothetical protein
LEEGGSGFGKTHGKTLNIAAMVGSSSTLRACMDPAVAGLAMGLAMGFAMGFAMGW